MQKRHDTIISGGVKILQSREAFCYSTDTLLLLDFINANYNFPPVLKMAELGSGTGGLCIAAAYQNPEARVTGIELQPKLNELARESARLNTLENIEFIDADLREIKSRLYPETFNLIAANPPYFKLGTGHVNRNSNKAQAKHEIKCTLGDVFSAAAYLLKKTGEFFLIHHYSRIFDVFAAAARYNFKLICFQPVYIDRSAIGENASHCLFAFGASYKKEPAVLAPRYIR